MKYRPPWTVNEMPTALYLYGRGDRRTAATASPPVSWETRRGRQGEETKDPGTPFAACGGSTHRRRPAPHAVRAVSLPPARASSPIDSEHDRDPKSTSATQAT